MRNVVIGFAVLFAVALAAFSEEPKPGAPAKATQKPSGAAESAAASKTPTAVPPSPSFDDYATVEAECDGHPVYSLGNITSIYGVSPSFLPGAELQQGNAYPKEKLKPKKSWEITSNLFGAYPASPQVRTAWNDSTPMLPLHLIDGDRDTVWTSYGCFAPDAREEWLRIDLPRESTASAVALVCSRNFAMGGTKAVINDTSTYEKGKLTDWMGLHRWAGRALPRKLTIQVSRDAWHWQTVYQTEKLAEDPAGTTVLHFDPVAAKQILVKGQDFPHIIDKYVGYAWSMGELEVRSPKGENLALLSRGAGVSASSYSNLMDNDRFTQEKCFAPVLYDLGLKWVVITSDAGMQGWHNVERVKDRLELDPAFDAMLSDLGAKGVKVIMGLDIKANPIYLGRKIDWRQARYREVNNDYYDCPGWVNLYPDLLAPYLRYVEFIARRFKGRVAYYSLAADVPESANQDLYAAAMERIKAIDPEVGLIGGEARFLFPGSSVSQGKLLTAGRTLLLREDAKSGGAKWGDAEASVRVRSGGGEAGLLLRFKDKANYLAATFDPRAGRLRIGEVVGGVASPGAAVAPARLGPEVTLRVRLRGDRAELSAGDGEKSANVSYRIAAMREPGGVGLFHDPGPGATVRVSAPGRAIDPGYVARFADFQARDLAGAGNTADAFEKAGGRAAGWRMVEGRWLADVPESERLLRPTMTTLGAQLQPDRQDAGGTLAALEGFFDAGRRYRQSLRGLGYEGPFNYWFMTWAAYPPGPAAASQPDFKRETDGSGFTDYRYWCESEMVRAKYVAQSFVGSAALDTLALYCNPYMNCSLVGQSLFRVPQPAQTITPMQPDPGYYVLRTLSTAMDGWQGGEFPLRFDAEGKFECFTFARGDNERMVAAWVPGPTGDGIVERKAKLIVPGIRASQAWAIDLFNGTEQRLNFRVEGDGVNCDGLLIKDYPVLIRFVK